MKRFLLFLITAAILSPAAVQADSYGEAKKAFDSGDLKSAIEQVFTSLRIMKPKEERETLDLFDQIIRQARYRVSTNPEYKTEILTQLAALPAETKRKIQAIPALTQGIEALRNTATPSPSAAAATTPTTAGLMMNVLYLDGKSSFVELPFGMADRLDNATVEVWVKWEKFNLDSHVFDFGRQNNAAVLMNEKTDPDVQFIVYDKKAKAYKVNKNKALKLGVWTHIAVVCGSGGILLYVDGVQVDQENKFRLGLKEISGGANFIGRSNWAKNEYFQGFVSEFRLWNGVRSSQEILAMKDRLLTGTEPDLAAYWRFNKADGVSVPSSLPKGEMATLVGTATIVSRPAIRPLLVPGELERNAAQRYTAGLSAYKRADYATAAAQFEEAISYVSPYKDSKKLAGESLYRVGMGFVSRKQFKEAVFAFRRCQELTPGYQDVELQEQKAKKLATKRVAVVPFETRAGALGLGNIGLSVADKTQNSAVDMKDEFVEFMPRSDIDRIISERSMTQSGLSEEATAAKLGKLAGLQVVVTGQINRVDPYTSPDNRVEQNQSSVTKTVGKAPNQKQVTYKANWTMWKKESRVNFTATYKIVDVETGKIIDTDTREYLSGDSVQWSSYSGDKEALPGNVESYLNKNRALKSPLQLYTESEDTFSTSVAKQIVDVLK